MAEFDTAREILRHFKEDAYLYGMDILPRVGAVVQSQGQRAALVGCKFPGCDHHTQIIRDAVRSAGVSIIREVEGAAPNAPREDLARITEALREINPDVIISFGGGSTIDCVKAAEVLRTLEGEIEGYFGSNLVSEALRQSGKTLTPHVAIQSAASSAAHLTKYANITDLATGQKKLIVDEAIVPARPVFDYGVTLDAPPALTVDGGLDGISHSLEVLYSAMGKPDYDRIAAVAGEGIRLIVNHLPQALHTPHDRNAREALGLGTDLGGYAIMLGGTNGAHLSSFSLVDILSHGRACGMLNPYYTVFFAPAITQPLRLVGGILRDAGYLSKDPDALNGRELGLAVAGAMIAFQKGLGLPTTLAEVPGFTDGHIERALAAAKNPQLKMKLENMPVALSAEMVDDYMQPILLAAKTGDLSLIRNVS